MTQSELSDLLNAAPDLRMAVVGDFCLDAYWMLDDSRSERSVETGLTTSAIRNQRYALGGAGNVVRNLRALGIGRVDAFGVTGVDPFGEQLRALLAEDGVGAEGVLRQTADWQTHVYIKPFRGDHEESRLDFGNFNRLDDAMADGLLERLEAHLKHYHAVVLNEQVVHGIHDSERFWRGLAALVARYPATPFLLDSRHYSDRYDGTIRKLNDHEALRLCGGDRAHGELVLRDEARAAATELQARWRRPVFVSRGARGCLVCGPDGVREVPGIQIVGRIDPVGAGDSLLAGIALALAAGGDALRAATLGNFVAAVTVRKLFQTGTASPAEVLSVGADPDYVYRPELADDPRQAVFVSGADLVVPDVSQAASLLRVLGVKENS